MYNEISQLLMYGDLEENEILNKLADIFFRFESGDYNRMELVKDINIQVKHLLKVATDYGFNGNLWHNYLTYFLMMNENPFSMTCEKVGASNGSVNNFVENDFKVFKALFDYDFSDIEETLGIGCFTQLCNYQAIQKKELMYNKNVSQKVQALSKRLEAAKDEKEFFREVTDFYRDYGVGVFGLNKAFRIQETSDGGFEFCAINNMDSVVLDDLVGYEIQKKKLVDNTEAFVKGRRANNVLLFGDSGTGKSTSIKAIVNQYYDDGLRMIEIYKHQFKYLSRIIAEIKNRNYKFIIYMDDLSFEEHEIEYKFLKAVIEGGVETKPDNILIYATSNRRHLIKETWNDRNDMDNTNDRHHSDTVEEKLSLVNRFGVTICYQKPTPKEYFNIVIELARREGVTLSDEELRAEA
ncbi:MAG: ATP-binding protein, partial [Agathobacter sp.]|nr:ATP-binding protein [Agathobacter sp.]